MINDVDHRTEEDFADLIAEVKASGEVPELSPLFWNHLSARVREAVAIEPIPRAWWSLHWRPIAALVTSVAAIALVAFLRTGMPGQMGQADAVTASTHEPFADVAFSEMWRLIEVAAPTIEMQSAQEAGLMPSQYATDQAIESLTPAQREALVRLLRKEMGAAE